MTVRKVLLFVFFAMLSCVARAQFNTDRLLIIGRSALYYEDYVLSIQYFNKIITAKPYLYEPLFYRAVAKYYLDDYVGAENDLTKAVEVNPYVVSVYELRGLTRIMQEKFDDAIRDYNLALRYAPENRSLWHNKILCKINSKDYEGAHRDIDTLLTKWSTYAKGYSMRGEVFMLQKDTTAALAALDKSLEIAPYDASTLSTKSIITLARQEWALSDSILTEAIRLQPQMSGLYINRALARVNTNNLRGAMKDYDDALDIDPNNFLGHYNRGLLRAQVGDDNRAITDFDFVINMEPDNHMALYNRALLLEKTGDIRGAIRDYSAVIDEYPSFWAGLQNRAACYRRLGMTREAERDEFKVYKEQLEKRLYGTNPRLDKNKQRKRSDKDPGKYNQLVVADEEEVEHEYSSDYRGRVQNRRADMSFLPMYELRFEEPSTVVVSLNDSLSTGLLQHSYSFVMADDYDKVKTDAAMVIHADSLPDSYHDIPLSATSCAYLYYNRANVYVKRGELQLAIDDYDKALALDDKLAPAYYNRGLAKGLSGKVDEAIIDLSKAGELGLYNAYSVIKKYQKK